jgi:hypothetical protein
LSSSSSSKSESLEEDESSNKNSAHGSIFKAQQPQQTIRATAANPRLRRAWEKRLTGRQRGVHGGVDSGRLEPYSRSPAVGADRAGPRVLLPVEIGGEGQGRPGSAAARGGGCGWREEEENGRAETSFTQRGETDGGRSRTAPPTRELGGRAARIGVARIFFGNGGLMRDLNGAFFAL